MITEYYPFLRIEGLFLQSPSYKVIISASPDVKPDAKHVAWGNRRDPYHKCMLFKCNKELTPFILFFHFIRRSIIHSA